MPRGDNLTTADRARGGRHSHGGGRGQKGGQSSRRGLASASRETRKRVA